MPLLEGKYIMQIRTAKCFEEKRWPKYCCRWRDFRYSDDRESVISKAKDMASRMRHSNFVYDGLRVVDQEGEVLWSKTWRVDKTHG